jgi:hypothetical protein
MKLIKIHGAQGTSSRSLCCGSRLAGRMMVLIVTDLEWRAMRAPGAPKGIVLWVSTYKIEVDTWDTNSG